MYKVSKYNTFIVSVNKEYIFPPEEENSTINQPIQSKSPMSSVFETSKSGNKSKGVENESINAKTVSKSSADKASSKSCHLVKKDLPPL